MLLPHKAAHTICTQILLCRPSFAPLFSPTCPCLSPIPSPVKSKLPLSGLPAPGTPGCFSLAPQVHRLQQEEQLQGRRPVCFLGLLHRAGPFPPPTWLRFPPSPVTSRDAWALGLCFGASSQSLCIVAHCTFFLRAHVGAWLEAHGTGRGWEVVSVGSFQGNVWCADLGRSSGLLVTNGELLPSHLSPPFTISWMWNVPWCGPGT